LSDWKITSNPPVVDGGIIQRSRYVFSESSSSLTINLAYIAFLSSFLIENVLLAFELILISPNSSLIGPTNIFYRLDPSKNSSIYLFSA